MPRSELLSLLEASALHEADEAISALLAGENVEAVGDAFLIDRSLESTYTSRAQNLSTRTDEESVRLAASVREFVSLLPLHIGKQGQWLRIGDLLDWYFLCCQSIDTAQLIGCMRVRKSNVNHLSGGENAA